MIFELNSEGEKNAKELYKKNDYFFPLIASVLTRSQNGIVFANDPSQPSELYVEHSFGFSQIFGDHDNIFEHSIENYLLDEKNFSIPKVRLYATNPIYFFDRSDIKTVESERQRFFLSKSNFFKIYSEVLDQSKEIPTPIKSKDLDEIESSFGILSRFWPNPESFLQKSHAFIFRTQGIIASICYAAAIEDQKAEIDVFTLPQFRGHKYGLKTATAFIAACIDCQIEPLWDCFTNNTCSMSLCKKLGFSITKNPYRFFTITK